MIKVPIKPLTPPISVTNPASGPNQPSTGNPGGTKPSTGGSGGSKPGKTGQSKTPTFEELFEELLKQYMPELVEYTPLSEEVLSETIRNWLRPAYEQAIQNRRDQTERINAELDADAWSRGMGQSTYVTDVKERQFENEMRDVDTLEGNYASMLAQQLYDALKAQQEKKLEVDQFNAEQINRAREKAAEAARALYQSYQSGKSHGSGGKSSGGSDQKSGKSFLETIMDAQPETNKVDYKTAANLIARMSSAERRKLYDFGNGTYASLRYDIIKSLGKSGFNALKQKYPA